MCCIMLYFKGAAAFFSTNPTKLYSRAHTKVETEISPWTVGNDIGA